MNNIVTPWQTPEIAIIMSIMDCIVINVEQNNIVKMEVNRDDEKHI